MGESFLAMPQINVQAGRGKLEFKHGLPGLPQLTVVPVQWIGF
jgi:hypothetical protein